MRKSAPGAHWFLATIWDHIAVNYHDDKFNQIIQLSCDKLLIILYSQVERNFYAVMADLDEGSDWQNLLEN